MTNKETQIGVNKIKPGTIGIEFVDTANSETRAETTITLDGNTAIPMTNEYALANLDPYKFSLENTGDFDLTYTVYLVVDKDIFPDLIEIDYDNTNTSSEASFKPELGTYVLETDEEKTKIALMSGTLEAGKTVDYDQLKIYLNEATIFNDYIGRSFKAHLEVEAEQANAVIVSTGKMITIEENNYVIVEDKGNNVYLIREATSRTGTPISSWQASKYIPNSVLNAMTPTVLNTVTSIPDPDNSENYFFAFEVDLSKVEYSV